MSTRAILLENVVVLFFLALSLVTLHQLFADHLLARQPTRAGFGVDESFNLAINGPGVATIRASTVWGALRGMETFSQLVQVGSSLLCASMLPFFECI